MKKNTKQKIIRNIFVIFGIIVYVFVIYAIVQVFRYNLTTPKYVSVRAKFKNEEILIDIDPKLVVEKGFGSLTEVILSFYNDSTESCLIKVTDQDSNQIIFEENIDTDGYAPGPFIDGKKVEIDFCEHKKIINTQNNKMELVNIE